MPSPSCTCYYSTTTTTKHTRTHKQPTESFLAAGQKETTSLQHDFDHLVPLKYCQVDADSLILRVFVSSGDYLDVTGARDSAEGLQKLTMLQQAVVIACEPCMHGWSRQEIEGGLWTCIKCTREQYIVDSNQHACQPCAAGATCLDGAFTPSNPADSVWNSTSSGIYRIISCPVGYVLIRDENEPTSDRCVPCAPDTYSVEEAVFGEKLWERSVENYNKYCHACPRSRARCTGANDVRPLAGLLRTL